MTATGKNATTRARRHCTDLNLAPSFLTLVLAIQATQPARLGCPLHDRRGRGGCSVVEGSEGRHGGSSAPPLPPPPFKKKASTPEGDRTRMAGCLPPEAPPSGASSSAASLALPLPASARWPPSTPQRTGRRRRLSSEETGASPSNTEAPSPDKRGASSMRPSTNGSGGGGGFLSSIKPSWLGGSGGGGSGGGGTSMSPSRRQLSRTTDRDGDLHLHLHRQGSKDAGAMRGRRTRATTRSRSLDPPLVPPSPSSRRHRPATVPAESVQEERGSTGEVALQRRRQSKASRVGRFGLGRTRSKSPPPMKPPHGAPHQAPEAAPSAAPLSCRAPPNRRGHAVKEGRRRAVDDADVDDSQEGSLDATTSRDADDAASLADVIYSRADERAPAPDDNDDGGLDPSKVDSPSRQALACEGAAVPTSALHEVEPVRSLNDLRSRIEDARLQRSARSPNATLAAIRGALGLARLAVDSSLLAGHVVPLYRKLVHSIQTKGDDSPYIQYVLGSSAREPEPAIMVFQFLHYLDVLVATLRTPLGACRAEGGLPSQPWAHEVMHLADEVAKIPTLACWCREVLRYPYDFPTALLECCLGHLQRFVRILEPTERRQHVWCILFRGSKDRIALDELRGDLERVVSRSGHPVVGESHGNGEDGAGFLTLARAVFLYNSVERAVGGNSTRGTSRTSASYADALGTFRSALDRHRNQVPDVLIEGLERQLLPQCAGPCCFRRAGVRCCDAPNACYCSKTCRDRGWRRHRRVCQHGTKVALPFPEPVAAPDAEQVDPSVNEDRMDEDASSPELLVSPQRRPHPDRVGVDVGADGAAKQALAALKTPQTPKVHLDVIDIFDELRVVPLVTQKSSTEWLLRQDLWLRECPSFDYFLEQPWGKVGLQFASAQAREEFRDLRRNAPHNVDDVEEMLEVLARCCPELKHPVRLQLEREYSMDLSRAADSPMRRPTSPVPPRGDPSKKPQVTPGPPPHTRRSETSLPAGDDRSRPWSIVMS